MGEQLTVVPIGQVTRGDNRVGILLEPPYRAGLTELDAFSHVVVLWWAQRHDDPELHQTMVVPLPYADGQEAGVFACRAPVRPNPVMTTVCAIEEVDTTGGLVRINDIDAFDGTPVIDLKPYYGVTDRVREPRVPDHCSEWPEWLPEEGSGLFPGEE